MSPLLGCEKSSVVCIIIHYTYYTLIVGQRINTGAQQAISNMRVRGIVAPYLSEIRNNVRTPRITEVRILSMQCVKD